VPIFDSNGPNHVRNCKCCRFFLGIVHIDNILNSAFETGWNVARLVEYRL